MAEKEFLGRKDPRLSLELPAEYTFYHEKGSGVRSAILKNISIASLDLETNEELRPEEEIMLKFTVPSEDNPVQVFCKVFRAAPAGKKDYWKIGLSILNIDEGSRKVLNDYIDSLGYYGWYYR